MTIKDTFQELSKKRLTPNAYKIAYENGTEPPFTGEYWNNHKQGMYSCMVCGQPLFSSDTKFDSGTGWPSFDRPVNREHIEIIDDNSFGMHRKAVRCKNCGAHLGHVFDDGPKETTGMRYCINSCSLQFKNKKQ